MNPSSISPEAVVAVKTQATKQEFAITAMRKVLDVQTAEAQMLLQLVAQNQGLGLNMDLVA